MTKINGESLSQTQTAYDLCFIIIFLHRWSVMFCEKNEIMSIMKLPIYNSPICKDDDHNVSILNGSECITVLLNHLECSNDLEEVCHYMNYN